MPALIVAIVIALTTAAGSGAVYASQDAIPGESLYPVKTTFEALQLALASDDETRLKGTLTSPPNGSPRCRRRADEELQCHRCRGGFFRAGGGAGG